MIGWLPFQPPGTAVRVWPCWAEPVIVGGAVFDGGVEAPCTATVAFEVALVVPTEFLAATTTRSVPPTSPAVAVYVPPVALAIAAQLIPALSQCCHWYV